MEENDVVIVYGEPKGKARPRTVTINGFVQTFTPKPTRDYEAEVRKAYRKQNGKKWSKEFPLKLIVSAYCKIPKSFTKLKKQQAIDGAKRPIKKPDLDNIIKIILDALNGVAYEDDCQVVEIKSKKFYSEVERVEIKLEEVKW
ncbi:MAG: RusA family crossover junction endodeoxyribonuclease [Clostridia bacterium]|nr:RusA family crossover junction endodeoxyribonuclease [Clostridia bacterium]